MTHVMGWDTYGMIDLICGEVSEGLYTATVWMRYVS